VATPTPQPPDKPGRRRSAKPASLQTVFEADPKFWQSGAIRSRLGNPEDIPRLPFIRARLQNVEMDLGVLEKSGATYMQFHAGGAVCDDLRLAYSKIMTEYEVYNEDDFDEMPRVSLDLITTPRSGLWTVEGSDAGTG
jgi:hypothetical protein